MLFSFLLLSPGLWPGPWMEGEGAIDLEALPKLSVKQPCLQPNHQLKSCLDQSCTGEGAIVLRALPELPFEQASPPPLAQLPVKQAHCDQTTSWNPSSFNIFAGILRYPHRAIGKDCCQLHLCSEIKQLSHFEAIKAFSQIRWRCAARSRSLRISTT